MSDAELDSIDGEVVLLGAGFSRAVSPHMPLLHDLTESVLADLRIDRTVLKPFGNDLEQWLSYLSADQPWLDDIANLRNRATFYEASGAVKRCIDLAESLVAPPEVWLERLVYSWAARRCTVATFNYDLLLERACAVTGLTWTSTDLYGISLDLRRPPSGGMSFGTHLPPGPLFSLYKLHGSVNWSYGGLNSPPSDRPVLTRDVGGWEWTPPPLTAHPAQRRPRNEDVVPLIVPPTGTKGPYYANFSLRAQWRAVHSALSSATSITIIGYSFPPTDLVARHLIASAKLQCPITIVDLSDRVAHEVRRIAPAGPSVVEYSGESAILDFVDATCGDVVRWGVDQTQEGLRAFAVVNGADRQLSEPPLSEEGVATNLGASEPWVEDAVDKAWPGVRERGYPRPAPDGHNGDWRAAYSERR